MKNIVIALVVLCSALIFLLWRNHQTATARLQTASNEIVALTNQLNTVEMKLNHHERLNISLGGQLTNNAMALTNSAEQIAALRATLDETRANTRAMRDELDRAKAGAEAAAAEAKNLSAQLEATQTALRDKDRQVADAHKLASDTDAARLAVARELVDARLENDALLHKWRNPAQLRSQLDTLEKAVAAAKHRRSDTSAPDLRLNLELQSDGTVRPLPPPPTEELRELERQLREKLASDR